MMPATLMVEEPTGYRFEVCLGRWRTLGRGEDQDIELQDKRVSRTHGSIAWADGYYWLQDRSSRNGTYLNGDQVYGPARLCDGDRIVMGQTTMVFNDACQRALHLVEDWSLDDAQDESPPADRLSRVEFLSNDDGSMSGSVND